MRTLLVSGTAFIVMAATNTSAAFAWETQKRSHAPAKPVACYKKVHQPAQYKWVKRRVLVQPESHHVEMILKTKYSYYPIVRQT